MPGLLWLWRSTSSTALIVVGVATATLIPNVVRAPTLQVAAVATASLIPPGEATALTVAGQATASLTPNTVRAPTLAAAGQFTLALTPQPIAPKVRGGFPLELPHSTRLRVDLQLRRGAVLLVGHAPQPIPVVIRARRLFSLRLRLAGRHTPASSVHVTGALMTDPHGTLRGRAVPPIVAIGDDDLLLLALDD